MEASTTITSQAFFSVEPPAGRDRIRIPDFTDRSLKRKSTKESTVTSLTPMMSLAIVGNDYKVFHLP